MVWYLRSALIVIRELKFDRNKFHSQPRTSIATYFGGSPWCAIKLLQLSSGASSLTFSQIALVLSAILSGSGPASSAISVSSNYTLLLAPTITASSVPLFKALWNTIHLYANAARVTPASFAILPHWSTALNILSLPYKAIYISPTGIFGRNRPVSSLLRRAVEYLARNPPAMGEYAQKPILSLWRSGNKSFQCAGQLHCNFLGRRWATLNLQPLGCRRFFGHQGL